MPRIAFLVGDVAAISGGANVIIEYASGLAARGHQVSLVVSGQTSAETAWHPKLGKLAQLTFAEAEERAFDFVFATFWESVFELWRLRARVYGYLNQSYESRFHYELHQKLLNRLTYAQPLFFFTEAIWIEALIRELQPGAEVLRLSNGLSREHFPLVEKAPQRGERLRVLIEGPWGVPFKGVAETLHLLETARARFEFDAGWLTSSSRGERPVLGGQAIRVHEKVPIQQVREVLGQYDVLIKLSRVEGVFGPPLEMFSQGGTAITTTVTGSDEVVVHGKNGLLVEPHNLALVPRYLEELNRSPALLARLRAGAIETARAHPGWDEQVVALERALEAQLQTRRRGAQLQEGASGVASTSTAPAGDAMSARMQLAAFSTLRSRYLDEVWMRERFSPTPFSVAGPLDPPIGQGELQLLRRYRELKGSESVRRALALFPSGILSRARSLFSRATK